MLEVVEEGRFEIEQLVDSDEADAVVCHVRLCGQARHTAIEFDLPFSITAWYRNGRIYRSESFSNPEEALRAAGLSE